MEDGIDSKYEFNAPKFIDFTQGDIDEDTDRWFDEREGDEGGIDINLALHYEEVMCGNGFESATSAITAALKDNVEFSGDNEILDNHVQEPMECDSHSLTEQNKVEHVNCPDTKGEGKVVISDLQVEIDSSSTDQVKDVSSAAKELEVKSEPVSTYKKSNIRKSWNSSPAVRVQKYSSAPLTRSKSMRNNEKIDLKRKKTLSHVEDIGNKRKKTKIEVHATVPNTPSFVRRLRERKMKGTQSSEAIQLNKIKELQKQTHAQIKRNDRLRKQAMKAMPYQPNRSASSVTKPKAFNFATDNRVKEHNMQTRSDAVKPFENQLRQHPTSPVFKKEPTKPKPFHFVMADKVPVDKRKWESMAQFAMNYQTRTPERFRLKPRKDSSSEDDKKTECKESVRITKAKTPLLLTKTRSRPQAVESAQEKELKEAEAMKSRHFKATEFNPKIVEMQGMYGVKQIAQASTTQIKPFKFESDVRLQQRKQKEENQHEVEDTSSKSKINTSTKDDKLRLTEVKPFSFESRDKERYKRKEEKIKDIVVQEEKMHEFHARPLPPLSPDALPQVSAKGPTEVVPFKISSGSNAYQQKLKQKLQTEAERDKMNRRFKAQNANVVRNKPFKPLVGLIAPTNPQEVVLSSDIRAKDRAKWEEWKHEREREMEEEKNRCEKEKALEEEKQIKNLRKEIVPKANPVRNYKAVQIQKSDKPLTEPHTPKFECAKRATIRL